MKTLKVCTQTELYLILKHAVGMGVCVAADEHGNYYIRNSLFLVR